MRASPSGRPYFWASDGNILDFGDRRTPLKAALLAIGTGPGAISPILAIRQ